MKTPRRQPGRARLPCPERRLRQHNAGTASRYTKRRLPVELALVVPAADRSAALREEARIKKLSRAEKLALLGRA